jgi:hypothetical protein
MFGMWNIKDDHSVAVHMQVGKSLFLPARGSSLGTSPAPQFHGPIGPYTCMITSSFIKTTLDKKREKRRKKKKKEEKRRKIDDFDDFEKNDVRRLFWLSVGDKRPKAPFLWISPCSPGRIITRILFVVFRLFRLPKKTCRGVICLPNLLSYQKRLDKGLDQDELSCSLGFTSRQQLRAKCPSNSCSTDTITRWPGHGIWALSHGG